MSKTFTQLLAKLEVKQRKQVTFKVIETHGMPICRIGGILIAGHLHAKECKNFKCDGKDVLGERMFEERLDMLEIRERREEEIDKIFEN